MTDVENLCMSCMSDMAGKTICPHCGWNVDEPQMPHALPLKTRLQNRYIIGRAGQVNGEGITYLAYDTVLNASVQIREFFPDTFCSRLENGVGVNVRKGNETVFQELRTSFLNYARELAHLRELSALVQIYDIFEENQTAYTVSEWEENITLRYFVERSGGNLTWNAARQLFMPVLSALSAMHNAGLCHFGISPDTLLIMPDGRMKLGEFCIAAVRQMDTDLPPALVPGCSAIEQYSFGQKMDEATDVYGFTASLFFALTGTLPLEALKRRIDSRLLIPTSILRSIPPHVVSGLANALQLMPEKRTSSFERLRAELSAAPTVTMTLEDPQLGTEHTEKVEKAKPKKKPVSNFIWVLVSSLVSLVVFTIIGIVWLSNMHTVMPQQAGSEVSSEEGLYAMARDVSSADTEKIVTPDLSGKNFEQLSNSSQAEPQYQLLLSTKQFSDTVPEGSIISQTPAPGTEMDKGTAIVVIVSQGPAVRVLPAVEGKTLAEASELAASAGFVPSKEEAYSASIEKGNVIGYKSAQAGGQLPYGTKVILLVSMGPDPDAKASSTPASSAN